MFPRLIWMGLFVLVWACASGGSSVHQATTPRAPIQQASVQDESVPQEAVQEPEPQFQNEGEDTPEPFVGVGGGGTGEGTIQLGSFASSPPAAPDDRGDANDDWPPCPARPYNRGTSSIRCSEDFWRRTTCVSRVGTSGSGLCGHRPRRSIQVEVSGGDDARFRAIIRSRLQEAWRRALRDCWEGSPESPSVELDLMLLLGPPGRIMGWTPRAEDGGAIAQCVQGNLPDEVRIPNLDRPTQLSVNVRFEVHDPLLTTER